MDQKTLDAHKKPMQDYLAMFQQFYIIARQEFDSDRTSIEELFNGYIVCHVLSQRDQETVVHKIALGD